MPTKVDRYPCMIYMESQALEGWCVIMRGHNLTPEQVQEQLNKVEPGTVATETEEHTFAYTPRVKWCSQYGSPCDQEGDWHGHWHTVVDRGDPTTHFTIAQYEYENTK